MRAHQALKTRRHGVAALAVLLGAIAIGCSSDPAPKADTGAPATTYKMVPATTGGGTAPSAPGSTPAPSSAAPANPASPGSD